MNEENVLGFEVRAKILPLLEGAEQFEQNLRNVAGNIQENVTGVVSSPAWQQDLSPTGLQSANNWLKESQSLFAPLNSKIDGILSELSIDMEGGSIGRPTINKYIKKLSKLQNDVAEFDPEMKEAGINPESLEIFNTAIAKTRQDAVDNLEKIKGEFKDLAKQINTVNTEADSFYNQMKKAGAFALGGIVVNETMRAIRTGAEIEAKDMTSFDLTSQVGMYGERKQYEVFQETRERERLYTMIGTALGGVLGSLVPGAGIIGASAGAYFGGQFGTELAGLSNVKTQAEMESRLKVVNQSYGTLSGYVNQSSTYDILRARAGARGIQDGDLDLGYMPEQELQMRMQLQETLGTFDQGLYREQTAFARATGLDPAQLYKLNLSSRMTGQDLGISGLTEAQRMSKELYGPDSSPSRIVDILTEIKNLSEHQLQLNVNADSRDALRIAQVPESIFGKDNPYGRIGDLGGATIKALEGFMKPGSLAEESFLFNAFGDNDIWNFTERMKGGIYSDNNLPDILKYVKDLSGGNTDAMKGLLYTQLKDAPQGFIPALMGKINEPGFIDQIETSWQKTDGMTKEERLNSLNEILGKAAGSYSETEKINSDIRRIQNDAADRWREAILGASKDMAEFWDVMGKNSEIQTRLTGALDQGMQYLIQTLNKMGIFQPGYSETDPATGHKMTPVYGPIKQDSGMHTQILQQLNEYAKEHGGKYHFNEFAGFDPTGKGHVQNSRHYTGDAIDFSVYDDKNKRIYKNEIKDNPELVALLKAFAEEKNYKYGGDFNDYNHIQTKTPIVNITFSGGHGIEQAVKKIQNSDVQCTLTYK